MSILRFLVQQDYFGNSFNVTINGQERTKTLVGFVFTLAFLGVILFAILKFVTDFFETSQPIVLLRDITNQENPKVRLNKNSVDYFFLLEGPDGFIQPETLNRYFNMTVYYEEIQIIKSNFVSTAQYTGVLRCSEAPWFKEKKNGIETKMRSIIEKYGVCAHDANADHLLYNGSDPPYGHSELQFRVCILGSSCVTAAEVSKTVVNFGTLEHYFDASDLNSPLKIKANIKNKVKINSNERKEYRYFINDVKVMSDTGFFSTSFSQVGGFQLSQTKIDQRKLYKSDTSLLQILFYTSGRHVEYTRTYYKFLNLLSDIGGVVQIIAFLVTVVYARYNTYIQNNDLIRYSLLGKSKDSKTSVPTYNEAENGNSTPKSSSVPSDKMEATPRDDEIVDDEIAPYSPANPDLVRKSTKRTFTILMENSRKKKLFNVDDYDFNNQLYLRMVNNQVFEPEDEMLKKQAALYSLFQAQLGKLRDIYELLPSLNEMSIMRHALIPHEIKPLLHQAAIESRYVTDEEETEISYRDAIQELLTAAPTSSLQAMITEFMLARIKVFEKRFNGEVHNHLRELMKQVVKSSSPAKS